ncbi:zinc metallopeptidase [Haloferula sp.]|uniref:zinc metallopeptidase n=1 Tax=Haloferula sp. TaxID=2497595 RepID=UPI0032A08B9D
MGYWILIGGTMLVSWLISSTLKRRFNEYSQIPTRMTGAEVAEAMLRQNGINDVKVIHTGGQLTDHYDPVKKTVNLSEPVYGMNSVAAIAVAAHECGHAIQHKEAYAWLTFRSKMVPAVQFASGMQNILMWMMILGIFAFGSGGTVFIWVFLGVMAITTLFTIVTLPVEFDASNRALAWLERSGIANEMQHEKAEKALFWAAMTYVVAAVTAIAQLAYWASMLLGRRD